MPLLLSIVGNAALFVSGWLGGHLVYHYKMRVQGVSPIESAPDLKIPGDEAIERVMQRFAEATPAEEGPDQYPRAA